MSEMRERASHRTERSVGMYSESPGASSAAIGGARPRRPTLPLGGCALLFCPLAACGPAAGDPSPAGPPVPPSATAMPSVPTLSTPLVTYKGHAGPVIGVAWSPDGKRLASCG